MRLILSIAASALLLAACANGYDKAAETSSCQRLAGKDASMALQVSGSGLALSGGYVIPARDLGGSGKLDRDWGTGCVRPAHHETRPPNLYDWRKVGMAL